jgi:hypothetical protein
MLLYYIKYIMKVIDILLLVIIAVILVIIFTKSNSSSEQFEPSNKDTEPSATDIDDFDSTRYLQSILNQEKKDSRDFDDINPNFMEAQFHNDYRDTITAFNNISPSQRQIFNQANVPAKFTNPSVSEVQDIINDFIREVNTNIDQVVTEHRHSNSGWDEPLPDKTVKSGWEKQMEHLGIPTGLYNKPASKEKVKLLKIDHVEKHETEDEVKYTCFLILRKLSVQDQIVVKVSFVMAKPSPDERNFFKDVKDLDNSYGTSKDEPVNLIVEEIFIIGFLTSRQINEAAKTRDDFYNFSALEDTEHISQKTIMKELVKKYKQRTKENNSFNATLDEEGRNYHASLPHLRNYKSYQVTQTIMDDWKGTPAFTTPTYT